MNHFIIKKIKIKYLLIILVTLLIGLSFFYLAKNKQENKNKTETYKIGFITDVHSYRTKKSNYDINDKSKKPLMHFIDVMNNDFKPDFVIENGDFIEGSFREGQKSIDDFIVANGYLKKLRAPFYHVMGNHEARGFSKNDWQHLTGNENTYYYFDHENLRVIVLDGNEMPGNSEEKAGEFFYISEKQIDWVDDLLTNADEKKLKKIIFMHFPITSDLENGPEEKGKKIFREDSEALRNIFSEHNVSAVFSGHLEQVSYLDNNNVKYFSLPGFYKSREEKTIWLESFSKIILDEKDVSVELYYKKDWNDNYNRLIIPSEEFNKIEK